MINYKKEIKKRLLEYHVAGAEIGMTATNLLFHVGTADAPKQPRKRIAYALKAYLLEKDGWDLDKMILEGTAEKK